MGEMDFISLSIPIGGRERRQEVGVMEPEQSRASKDSPGKSNGCKMRGHMTMDSLNSCYFQLEVGITESAEGSVKQKQPSKSGLEPQQALSYYHHHSRIIHMYNPFERR